MKNPLLLTAVAGIWLCGLARSSAAPIGVFDDAVDIGGPPAAGSTTLGGSTYTMKGSGDDIWDGGDQCQFAYKRVRGDFTMTMRVTRRDKTPAGSGQWGRHGLMARWSLEADSKYSLVATVLPTLDGPGVGAWHPSFHQFRMFHHQAATSRVNYWVDDSTFPQEGRLPTWMRLRRVGNAIYSYLAEDANQDGQPDRWVVVGSDSTPWMPTELLVGPYMSAQAGTSLGTMTFDNVAIVDNQKQPTMECSIGQTLISRTYDVGDPNAMAGATSIQCTNLAAAGPGVVSPGRLRLTSNTQNLGTAVWYSIANSQLMSQQGFIAEFDLFMSPAGKPDPADGMTFAVVEGGAEILAPLGTADLCGEPGPALGYGNGKLKERTEGHLNFAVEVDNWTIGGEPGNDPPEGGGQAGPGRYHVGLDVNAEVSSVQTNEDVGVPSPLLPDLFQPEGVHFWVQYFPDGQVDVYVASNKTPFTNYQVISHPIPPLQGPLLVGFTGGTGLAAAVRDVDNFRIRLTTCTVQPPSTLVPKTIDLGHIVGGGDGMITNPSPHFGMDPRNGRFIDAFIPGLINDFDPPGDHVNPSPGESPYIDSVFFTTNRRSGEFIFPQSITMSGVQYKFPDYDIGLQSYGAILKNQNGGVATPGINVGGVTHYTTGVGIPAALGITYDLDALRAAHGWRNVRCFSTTWGLDNCPGGEVDLFLIFASDAGVQYEKISRITQNGLEVVAAPIPATARYLTLACGSRGADLACDHGVLGRAVIGPLTCRGTPGTPSGDVWIWDVTPKLVSTLGGQSVTFQGEAMPAPATYRLGGKSLTGVQPVPPNGRIGVSPPLSEGFHDAEVVSLSPDIGLMARLRNAVEAAPPVEITSVEPDALINNSAALITVLGKRFRSGVTRFEIVGERGAREIGITEIDDTSATGFIPAGALPPGEPFGPKAVRALDPRGNVTFPNAIQFLDPSAIVVTSVTPNLVATAGGTVVTFIGSGFVSGAMVPRLGGKDLTEVSFLGSSQIRGTTPPLPKGLHAAQVLLQDTGDVVATRANAVEAAAPVVLTSITPSSVLSDGSTPVVARGQNLRSQTRIRIGARDLVSPALSADRLSISGLAPALVAGEALGTRDVVAVDPLGNSTLSAAVTYVAPPTSGIPGPQEMEGTLAEGTARFQWANPLLYNEIVVKDPSGRTLSRLPGDATFFETPAGDQAEVRLTFQGVSTALGSGVSEGLAHAYQCSRPPPLQGNPIVGRMQFSVYGGSVAATVTGRCGGGGGGSEAALEEAAQGRGGGSPQAFGSLGYIETNRDAVASGRVSLTNVLTTGFTLDQPADKLEIRAYYEKLIAEFGVSLRGRLVQVGVPNGFVDEFTFPEVLINKGKDWNCITYFRANRDVGELGAAACGLLIPKGDYLLDLYCVGGNSSLPYYLFADDGRDKPLLIEGSPCPPYPLVTVKDLTGYATLPVITRIDATYLSTAPDGRLWVLFKARGQWVDEGGISHPIDPDDSTMDASYVEADFEYTFTVYDSNKPAVGVSSTNKATICVSDFGCFEVQAVVKDKACGFTKSRTLEVAIIPTNITNTTGFIDFIKPTPDPDSVWGIVGLTPPPGQGRFSGRRPLDFRVLVVPRPCAGGSVSTCASPTKSMLQFRLAYQQNGALVSYLDIPATNIADLCGDVTQGPKYFKVSLGDPLDPEDVLDNLGRLPALAAIGTDFKSQVYLQARAANGEPWRSVGASMHLSNPPGILSKSFWTGSYDKQSDTYRFAATTSPAPATNFAVGPSDEVNLPLEGANAKIPAFNNGMNSGLIARFAMHRGAWSSGETNGVNSGEMLGNKLDGAPMSVAARGSGAGAGGAIDGGFDGGLDGEQGSGGAVNQYEWCKAQTIVDNSLRQTLFNAVLFTGLVGPIPVTVYARIALAMDIKVEALARVFLAPLEAFDGGTYFESDFYLLSKLDISIPCTIRADILFGIANLAASLKPQVRTNLDVHLGARNLTLEKGLDVGAYFDLIFELKACLELLVTSVCYEDSIPIFNNKKLLHAPLGDVPFCVKPSVQSCASHAPYCTPPVNRALAGGGASDEDASGGGPGGVPTQVYVETNAPVTVTSPDGLTTIDSWIEKSGQAMVFVNANPMDPPDHQAGILPGNLRDPVAAFLSNTRAVVVYSASFPEESGVTGALPGDLTKPEYYPPRNKIMAQRELLFWAGEAGTNEWVWRGAARRIADPVAEVPDPNLRRADGRASVAADLSRQEAVVAWVRYDTFDFLSPPVPGEFTKIWERQPDGTFVAIDAPTVRPQLRRTAIFSRRIGFNGLVGSRNTLRRVSSPDPGINIEPSIACSPSGAVAYCVWVNDALHNDLVTSNQGRRLLYSVYNRSRDVDTPASNPWGGIGDVVLNPEDHPGLLEPMIQLKSDRDGLLAFTALDPAETTPTDSGLTGGTRYVYTCRLDNGAFGPPVRIRGECLARVYGSWPMVKVPLNREVFDPVARVNRRMPDWVGLFQGTGALGSREGSGSIQIVAMGQGKTEFSAPVTVSPGGIVMTNVTATPTSTSFHTVSLNQGLAKPALAFGAGGGAGVDDGAGTYQVIDVPLQPDLAIESCTLSDPFSGPGGIVLAKATVQNLGLSGSPYDNTGRSMVEIQAVLMEDDGSERIVAVESVPELQPGDAAPIELMIEMPLDPVRLRVELSPNPLDTDPSNDAKVCFFGAPTPLAVTCRSMLLSDVGATLAAQLVWECPALYDEVRLYRDGAALAVLPPTTKTFIDQGVGIGVHEYAVQGIIGASKSRRAACSVKVGDATFLRGDSDANGRLDISDGIFTLNYLFSGGRTPICLKAADSDDSGSVDLSDAVVTLGFLFLGTRAPARPYPSCGSDPTPDALACETQPGCR